MMGSFNISIQRARMALEDHLARRRSYQTPEIKFEKKNPFKVEMPKFQNNANTHAPLNLEDESCQRQT